MEAHLIQGSDSWKNWRKDKIGASALSVIMGVNPWKSPNMLWSEMLNLKEPDRENEAMRRGTELEPIAREYYFKLTNIEMFPKVIVHPRSPRFFASLDGINSTETQILEIKCGGKKLHEDAKNGIIPDYYNIQMQWQMYITGLYDCHYLSFDGSEGILIVVKRDQDIINQMIIKAVEFLHFLDTITPPPFTDLDYQDLSMDLIYMDLLNKYSLYDDSVKYFTDLKEKLKNQIVNYVEGKNAVCPLGILTKVISKGRIQFEKIEALKEIDLDQYRGPSIESYRITLTKD